MGLAILLISLMLLLLFLGFPMFVPLLGSAAIGLMVYFRDIPAAVLVQQWIGGAKPVALVAVPMFIFFGADSMAMGQAFPGC